MCLTRPATVLARFDNEVLVEIDGRNRLVTNLVVPDLRVGDEVLVGLGNVLTRITDAEAAAARELIDAALEGRDRTADGTVVGSAPAHEGALDMRVPHTIGWGIALALATAIISGFSIYLNGRFVKLFDDPTLLAAVRNGLVGLALVGIAVGAGTLPAIRRLSGRERLGLLAIGIIGGGIPFALFFEGLALSSSPAAAVIHKTLFLWVAVLAVPLLGERLGALPIAALLLLLTGTVMLAPAGSIGTGPGELMILAATWCWAVEVVIARWLLRGRVPASLAAAARMTIGSLTLFVIAGSSGGLGGVAAYGAEQWTAIAITGALLAGYVLTWYVALQRAPATTVTSVLVVGAVITTGLQVITSGTAPTVPSLVGNVLLVGGCVAAIVGARMVLRGGTRDAVGAAGWSST